MKKKNSEDIEVDIEGFENARRQDILDSGKYIEFRVLIGEENPSVPSMNFAVHDMPTAYIGVLYAAIQSFLAHLEEEYPLHCLIANLTTKPKEIGCIDLAKKSEEKKKKKKGE